MLRTTIFLLYSVIGMSNLFAQDMIFDEPHVTDGAVILKSINGVETPVNMNGQVINTHPVFRMNTAERELQGLSRKIVRNQAENNVRSESGPTFHLTYLDQVNATGQGFDDPNVGAARRATLEAAFAYYASLLENDGEADVEIRQSFNGNPNSNPFAFSAAYYFGSKGFNSPFTQANITTGNDPYGAYPDGYLQFNFHSNLNYHYNASTYPSSQEYDFYTIALHEILHMLGFTSYSTESGASAASDQVYTTFDEMLIDQQSNVLFEASGSGSGTTVSTPDDGTLTSNQIWFELYPGQRAPVFSPDPFNGSSLDHFDNGRSGHGEYLMHPSLSKGVAFKLLHEDEVRVLERMGYAVNYSIATAIEEDLVAGASNALSSSLYPNPAYSYDRIQIELNEVTGKEVLVIVYDMLGKESYSKVILNKGPGPITAIDPNHHLPPGMYIVIGSSDDELFNQKLVIK